jgi:hypothetical protein
LVVGSALSARSLGRTTSARTRKLGYDTRAISAHLRAGVNCAKQARS